MRFNDKIVHEGMEIEGKIGELASPMFHDTAPDLETILRKRSLYSGLDAEMMLKAGKSSGLTKAITHGGWAFFRLYIVKCGFLDGRMGFVSDAMMAVETYYKYVKLWLLSGSNVMPNAKLDFVQSWSSQCV